MFVITSYSCITSSLYIVFRPLCTHHVLIFYPHMPISKLWIYRLQFCVCVFVCLLVCLFVRLRISPPPAESNFARRFIDVQGRKSHIFGNFPPSEAPNRTIRRAREPPPRRSQPLPFGSRTQMTDAPYRRSWNRAAYGLRTRIGMCGYIMLVPLT